VSESESSLSSELDSFLAGISPFLTGVLSAAAVLSSLSESESLLSSELDSPLGFAGGTTFSTGFAGGASVISVSESVSSESD